MVTNTYNPRDFGGDAEVELIRKFRIQRDDAFRFFFNAIRPRLDRSYKLYIGWNGDRAREIKSWQANIFVPYVHGVIETLMPRIIDARPEFTVQGRNADDQLKADKLQDLSDYIWEISGMDDTSEMITRAALVYGTGFMQASWKKDVRELKFLKNKELGGKKKLKYEKREQVFYDAPFCEWVDNYNLWYDWHNIPNKSKQYWFKRLVLTGAEIQRRYPLADKVRLAVALATHAHDLNDYGTIRYETKLAYDRIGKGADYRVSSPYGARWSSVYNQINDPALRMHEVFEWWRPFDDSYAVMVNDIPVLEDAVIPIPFDFKEAPFIDVPYLKLPGEFEGVGLPMLLENPQVMLNMVKNQRLDATTLSIHKMWIVNPLANIDKKELVTRPFGIIYSTDPNGVREVQFSDIKASAYKEEDLLKADMRYASGVDDFSMGAGGQAGSATEVRHLRESTLERVRLFINHLGDSYAQLLRYWLVMYKQFFTNSMTIRIIGEDGREKFPLIEKEDLRGEFDFKASVKPSIAGKNDIDKKQGMDLFQLLINMPFVDPRKLTSKILSSFSWSLDSVSKEEEPQGMPGMEPGAPGGLPPGADPSMAGLPPMAPPPGPSKVPLPMVQSGGEVSPSVIKQAIAMLGKSAQPEAAAAQSPFTQAALPINLLKSTGLPPTAKGVPATNPRGLSRAPGAKVNTNVNTSGRGGNVAGATELTRASSLQRKK